MESNIEHQERGTKEQITTVGAFVCVCFHFVLEKKKVITITHCLQQLVCERTHIHTLIAASYLISSYRLFPASATFAACLAVERRKPPTTPPRPQIVTAEVRKKRKKTCCCSFFFF